MSDVGSRFVAALAAKDTGTLLGIFADHVSFRGMTPGRFWDVDSPDEAVKGVLYQWFEPEDVIEAVEHVEERTVVDRQRVAYRFRVRNPDGVFQVEPVAYFDLYDDGRVSRMHVLCSGYRPVVDAATT
jgi:hypothetical protein